MNYKKIETIYNGINSLKKLIRKGWELKGVKNPESVADHVFGVSFLAICMAKEKGLDIEKIALISLLHEVCEIETGDITPHDGISEEQKQREEMASSENFLMSIDSSGYYFELWKDFEFQRTPEGRFVKDIDRLEMAFQASKYEGLSDKPLDEFYLYVENKLKDKDIKTVFLDLKNEVSKSK